VVDWFSIAIWSLVGTWILVIGTLALMYWQTRTTQRLNSANAVMSLRERFDSPHMRAARRHLSQRLLAQAHDDISSMEVVTFFELVGTLSHARVLDSDLVWEAFGSWVAAYYWAIRHPFDLIGKIRGDLGDPLLFHEFEWLNTAVLAIDVRHQSPPAAAGAAEEASARRILELEATLASV
jgi:hypothetical protein